MLAASVPAASAAAAQVGCFSLGLPPMSLSVTSFVSPSAGFLIYWNCFLAATVVPSVLVFPCDCPHVKRTPSLKVL